MNKIEKAVEEVVTEDQAELEGYIHEEMQKEATEDAIRSQVIVPVVAEHPAELAPVFVSMRKELTAAEEEEIDKAVEKDFESHLIPDPKKEIDADEAIDGHFYFVHSPKKGYLRSQSNRAYLVIKATKHVPGKGLFAYSFLTENEIPIPYTYKLCETERPKNTTASGTASKRKGGVSRLSIIRVGLKAKKTDQEILQDIIKAIPDVPKDRAFAQIKCARTRIANGKL